MPDQPLPIDPNFGGKSLGKATVQEIQLELFRRSISARAGKEIVQLFISVLLENYHLWQGAVIDRLGINEGGHWLQPASMIKLRDIETNFWNADTLHVLCRDRPAADQLVKKLPMEDFGCMPSIEDDPVIVDRAMGGADPGSVIVRFWWD